MANRIDQKFKELKQRRKKAFIAFITAGDPNLVTTEKLVLAFEKVGADLIELGVPFSDPLADGPTIQASSQRALANKTTLTKILHLVAALRRKTQIPICLMGYYNPIFHFGEVEFVSRAKEAGVDGLIIPDLPPEEARLLMAAAKKNNLATVFFIAPTTTKERMKKIAQAASGFIYYVSLTGVTGARKAVTPSLAGDIRFIKSLTQKPVCVGFGVSTPAQVASVAKVADGVIVGSAIVSTIAANAGKKDVVRNTARFVQSLTKILK